jgi:hypothetical protein
MSKFPRTLWRASASSRRIIVDEARPANDFKRVQPYLEKTLDLSRQLANYFPGYEHIADPLIDFADEGMKVSKIRPLFAELRTQLVPIVRAITSQPPADDSCLKQLYPEAQQLAFGQEVIKVYGYDFNRGRQDKTHHPFMTKFSLGDVRITTRVKEHNLGDALFSTMHEAGHAMYEQGIRMDLEGTPLAGGTSSGVHESQSRTWENLVGRSRNFWLFFYPRLQVAFPAQLKAMPFETFYRAINKVERSLIRTDADEVTYNLHVMIRFDFETRCWKVRWRFAIWPMLGTRAINPIWGCARLTIVTACCRTCTGTAASSADRSRATRGEYPERTVLCGALRRIPKFPTKCALASRYAARLLTQKSINTAASHGQRSDRTRYGKTVEHRTAFATRTSTRVVSTVSRHARHHRYRLQRRCVRRTKDLIASGQPKVLRC